MAKPNLRALIATLMVAAILAGCSQSSSPPQVKESQTPSMNPDSEPSVRICSAPWPNNMDARMVSMQKSRPALMNSSRLRFKDFLSYSASVVTAQEAVLRGYNWTDPKDETKARHELKVIFLDGDPQIQQKIQQTVRGWADVIDVKFTFGGAIEDSDIRIGINSNGSSWSKIGNSAALTPRAETMHFGWFNRSTSLAEYNRTVLHEFGHALGAIHEHQSPAGIPLIHWNTDVVYAWCNSQSPPWSHEDCDNNVINRYRPEQAIFTRLDRASIMVYSFPSTWTVEGVSMPTNWQLSNDDIALMQGLYGTARIP
jgi:hypothetical protein